MTYLEKVSFDGKQWYQLEWEGIGFRVMDGLLKVKDCQSMEDILKVVAETYPDCNIKIYPIEKRKKENQNGTTSKKRSRKDNK